MNLIDKKYIIPSDIDNSIDIRQLIYITIIVIIVIIYFYVIYYKYNQIRPGYHQLVYSNIHSYETISENSNIISKKKERDIEMNGYGAV